MVSERCQPSKLRLVWFHLYEVSGTGNYTGTKEWVGIAAGSGGGEGEGEGSGEGLLKASEVSVWGDENVL